MALEKKKKKNKDTQSEFFHGLPVEAIEEKLAVKLAEGPVELSAGAKLHATKRHPDDVPLILPHLADIIAAPLYVGQNPKHPGKIELIGRIPQRFGGALVSIEILDFDKNGTHNICSMYLINQSKFDRLLSNGALSDIQSDIQKP